MFMDLIRALAAALAVFLPVVVGLILTSHHNEIDYLKQKLDEDLKKTQELNEKLQFFIDKELAEHPEWFSEELKNHKSVDIEV